MLAQITLLKYTKYLIEVLKVHGIYRLLMTIKMSLLHVRLVAQCNFICKHLLNILFIASLVEIKFMSYVRIILMYTFLSTSITFPDNLL